MFNLHNLFHVFILLPKTPTVQSSQHISCVHYPTQNTLALTPTRGSLRAQIRMQWHSDSNSAADLVLMGWLLSTSGEAVSNSWLVEGRPLLVLTCTIGHYARAVVTGKSVFRCDIHCAMFHDASASDFHTF
jgi:hypothetical protein